MWKQNWEEGDREKLMASWPLIACDFPLPLISCCYFEIMPLACHYCVCGLRVWLEGKSRHEVKDQIFLLHRPGSALCDLISSSYSSCPASQVKPTLDSFLVISLQYPLVINCLLLFDSHLLIMSLFCGHEEWTACPRLQKDRRPPQQPEHSAFLIIYFLK